MKVALIIPDRPYLLKQKALPHLGLLYVSSSLKELGHDVEVLDFADGWKFTDADLYGISITTPDFPRAIEILKFLKNHSDRKVIAGGPHATLCPREVLRVGFDAVSIGDGELTIRKLIGNEKIFEAWAEDIDKLPPPDRTAIDLWDYEFYICGTRATSIMTARGCAWRKCSFCSRIDKMVRFHSWRYVDDELKDISKLGFGAVMIYDDEFFTYPKRDMKIIDCLRRYDLTWRCFGRSDYILRRKDIIELASKAGLKEILLGVESADDKILKTVQKGTTVEMNKEAIKFLSNLGIRVKAAMIVGLPGENKESLMTMEKFCEEMAPYVADWDFSLLQVYPGSDIWRNPHNYDIKISTPTFYKGIPGKYVSTVSTSNLSSEELAQTRDYLEKKFKKW